jgi:hypothetical protein
MMGDCLQFDILPARCVWEREVLCGPIHLARFTSSSPKVPRSFRMKDCPGDQGEENTMHSESPKSLKSAQYDVKCYPSQRQPARPVLAPQHEHTGNSGHKRSQFYQEAVVVERTGRAKLSPMGDEADCTYGDVETRDQ